MSRGTQQCETSNTEVLNTAVVAIQCNRECRYEFYRERLIGFSMSNRIAYR